MVLFRKATSNIKLSVVALVLAVPMIANTLSSTPAYAAVRGIDVQWYCSTQYAGAYGKAVTVGSNAYSWRCQVRWNVIFTKNLDIDMNHACKKQYGTSSRAYLINNDSSSLYNWRCR